MNAAEMDIGVASTAMTLSTAMSLFGQSLKASGFTREEAMEVMQLALEENLVTIKNLRGADCTEAMEGVMLRAGDAWEARMQGCI